MDVVKTLRGFVSDDFSAKDYELLETAHSISDEISRLEEEVKAKTGELTKKNEEYDKVVKELDATKVTVEELKSKLAEKLMTETKDKLDNDDEEKLKTLDELAAEEIEIVY